MALLNIGDPAPDFDVVAHTGERVRSSDPRGKPVVLWFYPKADTPGCTIEGCSLRDKTPELSAKGAVVLGVSFDTVEENRAFAEKFGFPYLLLCDTERKIGLAYGACDEPTAGYAQRISYLISPEGKVAAVWGKVNVNEHAAEILAALG